MGANARRRSARRLAGLTSVTPLTPAQVGDFLSSLSLGDEWGVSVELLDGPVPSCDLCNRPAVEVGSYRSGPFARCLDHLG